MTTSMTISMTIKHDHKHDHDHKHGHDHVHDENCNHDHEKMNHLEQEGFMSISFVSPLPFSLRRFRDDFMEKLPKSIFRSKGLLWFSKFDERFVFHWSGSRFNVEEEPWPENVTRNNQLVVIGRNFDKEKLTKMLESCVDKPGEESEDEYYEGEEDIGDEGYDEGIPPEAYEGEYGGVPGAMPQGVMPPGAMPTGVMYPGVMLPGVPAGGMPAGGMPAGGMPAAGMPAGAISGAVPGVIPGAISTGVPSAAPGVAPGSVPVTLPSIIPGATPTTVPGTLPSVSAGSIPGIIPGIPSVVQPSAVRDERRAIESAQVEQSAAPASKAIA